MKKVLFLLLFLTITGTADLFAQVTIGDNNEPHPGAILDLKSIGKGLLLPKADLVDVTVFQLTDVRMDEAVGMMVFNTYDATLGGQGVGVYVWDGAKWMFIGISGPVQTPVTNITVRSDQDAVSVPSGSNLLFYADVMPSNATNRNVAWYITPGTGTGTISPASADQASALFTGNAAGTVTIRACATDGSNVCGEKAFTVTPGTVPVTDITISPSTAQTITAGETVQFTASIVPSNASNPGVTWSIVSGTDAAISVNGLFSGSNIGEFVVRASAAASPGIYRDVAITVLPSQAANCDGCRALAAGLALDRNTYKVWGYRDQIKGCYIAEFASKSGVSGRTVLYHYSDGVWALVWDTGTASYPAECTGTR